MTPRPDGFWSEKTNTQPFPESATAEVGGLLRRVIEMLAILSMIGSGFVVGAAYYFLR